MALRKTPVVGNDSKTVVDFTDKKYDAKSVVRIQSLIRKHQAKKKYQIKPLKTPTQYHPILVTNEPFTRGYRHPEHKSGSTALIGSSFLYSVIIACELSNPHYPTKLFLVDNSQKTNHLWKGIQKAIHEAHPFLFNKDKADLYDFDQEKFFSKIGECKCGDNDCGKKMMAKFFKEITKKYGYEQVLRVMVHASVIQQNWSDQKTFQTLKNIIDRSGYANVYAYASNIVACEENKQEVAKMLGNIQLLKPMRSIHADLAVFGYPENMYFFDDQTPHAVLEKIGANRQLNKKVVGPAAVVLFAILFLGAAGKLRPSEFLRLISIVLVLTATMMRGFYHHGSGSPTLSRDAFFKLPVGNSSDQKAAVVERKTTPGLKDKQC